MTTPSEHARSATPSAPLLTAVECACAAVAVGGGAAAWVVPGRLSGHVEAWDGPLWWLWLALTGALAFVLAVAGPRRWWLWPLLLCLAQFGANVVQTRGGPLILLGAVLWMVIAGGLMAPAFVGAWVRRRLDPGGSPH